jgi:hypothetical protein
MLAIKAQRHSESGIFRRAKPARSFAPVPCAAVANLRRHDQGG